MTIYTEYKGFVYLWYDRRRKKFCLGSHMGSLDDGYISGTGYFERAYKKRPHDMKRRILSFVTNEDRQKLYPLGQKGAFAPFLIFFLEWLVD